ncbi:MAG: hypothetical protein E4G96_08880 [Chrysiogenales bacterium]|nr:MAG: hypothetical protein E4G96_08880 [Chrysiogenales bacterium]
MVRVLDEREVVEAYRSKGASRFPGPFVEYIMSRDDSDFRPSGDPDRPLAGLRVAIDPGHSAGSMDEAVQEGKYILLFTPGGEKLTFYEAALNMATARILKEMLERDGASVMLTREKGGQVHPIPFDIWVKRDFREAVREKAREGSITPAAAERLLRRSNVRSRLKFFNSEFEMPQRARLINRFRPHVTVLAHYDARDATPAYRTKYLLIKDIARDGQPCGDRMKHINEVVDSISELKDNFCSAFVPGCFLPGELNSMDSRIDFLRLIVSTDLDRSISFSRHVVNNFRRVLDVPPAGETFPGSRLVGRRSSGVYARNLRMTRMVRGSLCLGEPLQQNNLGEARRLAEISNGQVPDRIRDVARAYHRSIIEYAARYPER